MSRYQAWLEAQGLNVTLLECRFDPAFKGVILGGTYHHAAYDVSGMIDCLSKKGYSADEAKKLFDGSYYPLSEQPGGPRFLIAPPAEFISEHESID